VCISLQICSISPYIYVTIYYYFYHGILL